MPETKYTLRLQELRRVSAVDNPAQPTASIRLIKRHDSSMQKALVDLTAEFTVAKLDDDLRLVFGYAFTSTKDGEPYHDLQGDHVISDDDMIKAALEFVTTGARADVMHDRLDRGGSVPFVMPLTPEIAKAFGLEGGEVGLMIGMRPDEETYAKFKDGTYKAFSIEGVGVREKLETEKRAYMTDEVDGHAHLIEDIDYDGLPRDAGDTSWSESEGSDGGHQHPWIKNADGDIVVGASEGHTHTIRATTFKNTNVTETPAAKEAEPKENHEMPNNEELLQKKVDDLDAKLSKAIAYGALTDAEKSYHAALPEDERDAWVSKSRAARAEDIAKEAEADSVEYTADDGTEYRKSDGDKTIRLAKQNDELARNAAVEKAERERVELEKRAEDELGNFTGSVKARAALLRAVSGIEDEEVRKEVEESLRGADGTVARMHETVGTWKREASPEDPIVKFEALVNKRVSDTDEPYGVAYNSVLDTPEGLELMEQHRASSN